MARPENRLQLMERLGAKQANTVWAWCGVDDNKRRVYFSLWTDLTVKVNRPGFRGGRLV